MSPMSERKHPDAPAPPVPAVKALVRSFTPRPSSTPQSAEAKVLVIDADGVSRRFLELSLSSSAPPSLRVTVEGVRDAAGALDVLKSSLVDVIVCETELPDMSGVRLFRLLQQESRLRSTPFVFMSADARVETKVVAFRAGVDDYVVKPCDGGELRARIARLISKQTRARQAQRERSYTLGGDFSTLPLPDLVSILELSRRSGVLSITTQRAGGEVLFEQGQVVHAAFGNLIGCGAFHRLMSEADGSFELTPGDLPLSAPRTVNESVASLLMESARLLDDQRRDGNRGGPPSAGLFEGSLARPSSIPVDGALAVALPASATLGAHFDTAISDPFAVGELKLWKAEELALWTRAELGRERFHVHLVADLSHGVAALLSMAGPPAERWVRDALSAEMKALGLAFFLRYERLFDVVLIDIKGAGEFLGSLQRRPALTIVAPRDGDALGVGPRGLVELESMLRRLTPDALLWVAHTELPSSIGAAVPTAQHLASRGALGDSQHDLRELMARGIRLWSGPARGSVSKAGPA